MIKKLLQIKNLGIYNNFLWKETIPEFGRFNLIYGWNGSGKTTLSQLFSIIENGNNSKFPNLKYKISSDDGEFGNNDQYTKQIRVFNQDYIAENINVLNCKANPIFILGDENKKLAQENQKYEVILRGDPTNPNDFGKLKERELLKKQLLQKNEELEKLFSDIAKTISINTTGVTQRNYNRGHASKDFYKLESKNLLSEKQLHINLDKIKQQEKNILAEIPVDGLKKEVENIISIAKSLVISQVESVVINRLIENPDILKWVEDGIKLHRSHQSNICEYCKQPILTERNEELLAFFNAADKKLKNDIDELVTRIDNLQLKIENLKVHDKANFYTELYEQYDTNLVSYKKHQEELIENIKKISQELSNKKLFTTESLELSNTFSIDNFLLSTNSLNTLVKTNNEISNNFSSEKQLAANNIKNHYLSCIFDEVHNIQETINHLNDEIKHISEGNPNIPQDIGIITLQERIENNKRKISNSGLACDEINRQLEVFLGRKELVFEIDDDGYLIKRNGEIAKNLSEGEKTAIAFVYFTIGLKDKEFNISNGIVIIDDPISSLDSNSLFQAFAFLKNSVNDALQFFIFTHNYDFLQLLINWITNIPKRDGIKSFYMIKNFYDNGIRRAEIDNLDDLLRNYSSEYQYLFKILYNFSSDGTIESVYHMPNVARKVLDNFLMIVVPNNEKQYKKLLRIPFDEQKKTAIYKFTNDQSHITGKGFDPSLVSESQNSILYLLEMIETVFPSHYKVLVESIKKSENIPL